MAEAANQSESMEDILQSIKRIIEDDSEGGEAAPAAAAEDVLELTQVVKEDGSVDTLSALPSASQPKPEQVMVASAMAHRLEPKPAPKPTPTPIPYPEESLVSEQAAQAAVAALKPIAQGGARDYSIPHVPSMQMRNGNTVEDLMLEALRPMLKAWLDEHLPLIVQKIVEKEVKRLVTFHQS